MAKQNGERIDRGAAVSIPTAQAIRWMAFRAGALPYGLA